MYIMFFAEELLTYVYDLKAAFVRLREERRVFVTEAFLLFCAGSCTDTAVKLYR